MGCFYQLHQICQKLLDQLPARFIGQSPHDAQNFSLAYFKTPHANSAEDASK